MKAMRVSSCVIVMFFITLPAVADRVAWSGNGHEYEAVSVPSGVTWFAANAAAAEAGGHLATITSLAENDFVFRQLVNSPEFWTDLFAGSCCSWGPWIGGFQPDGSVEPSDNWQWVTGEPFEFTMWRAGEPNQDDGTNEDHLHFFAAPNGARSNRWNDFPGGRQMVGYVVEYIPEPSTLLLGLAVGLMLLRSRNRR